MYTPPEAEEATGFIQEAVFFSTPPPEAEEPKLFIKKAGLARYVEFFSFVYPLQEL